MCQRSITSSPRPSRHNAKLNSQAGKTDDLGWMYSFLQWNSFAKSNVASEVEKSNKLTLCSFLCLTGRTPFRSMPWCTHLTVLQFGLRSAFAVLTVDSCWTDRSETCQTEKPKSQWTLSHLRALRQETEMYMYPLLYCTVFLHSKSVRTEHPCHKQRGRRPIKRRLVTLSFRYVLSLALLEMHVCVENEMVSHQNDLKGLQV